MTLSEFLKCLKPYYADIVVSKDIDALYQNTSGKLSFHTARFTHNVFAAALVGGKGISLFSDVSLPQKLYNGRRELTAELAEKLIPYLNKGCFIDFINEITGDALDNLKLSFGCANLEDEDFCDWICCVFFQFIFNAVNSMLPSLKSHQLSTGSNTDFSPRLQIEPPQKEIPIVDLSSFFYSHVPAKAFINRDASREVFYEALNSAFPIRKNVFMYYGIGGIGKSSLIKNLKSYVQEKKILFSSVDFDNTALHSPYRALIELETKLGVTLPHFDMAVALCFIKRNPEFSYRDFGLPNRLSYDILKILQTHPCYSAYNATAGLVEKAYSALSNKYRLDRNIVHLLSSLEEHSATEIIEQKLPLVFAADLYRHMIINSIDKCVLFFDTYELLWEDGRGENNKLSVDSWIRTIVANTENVIFVLSGREKLQWNLESETWEDKITFIPLDVLAPKYALQYLVSCNIVDNVIQTSIITATHGHPYYLDLCVDTYYKLLNANSPVSADSFGKGYQEIQECFFRSLIVYEINMLRVLSVPRFYDYDIFEKLAIRFNTGYPLINFDNFNSFSFIKHEINGKYIIHILMRDEIKLHMHEGLRQSIHATMIEYFKDKLSSHRVIIEDIRYYFSELLFHLQSSESDKLLLERIENEFMSIIKRLQISGETKYLLKHLSPLFYKEVDSLGGTDFFSVMVDMIHLSGNYREAVKIITKYLSQYELRDIAENGYLLNLYIRRTHHQMFYEPIHELGSDLIHILDMLDYDKHIEHFCEITFMLGAHIYLPLGEFEQASDYLRRMNKTAKQHGLRGLLCRGLRKFAELLCEIGKYDSAEKVCLAGLIIAREESLWRYEFYLRCVLGEIKRLTVRTDEALSLFKKAMSTATSLGINGWIGHVNLALGNCYADIKEYSKAFCYYDEAFTFYDNIGQVWGRVNTRVAYQRALLLSKGDIDDAELSQLLAESRALSYRVLSKKISALQNGSHDAIRFEYL